MDSKLPKLIFGNIQGLKTRTRKDKVKRLCEMACEENAFAIALAETHLREEIRTAEVVIPGYSLERIDRANKVKKGGVAVYFRHDIAHLFGSSIGDSKNNTEYYCCYSPKFNLVLAVVYRPEGSAGFWDALSAIQGYVSGKGPPLPSVVVVGDFNFPQVDWESGQISGACKSGDERRSAHLLREFCESLCLTQIIDVPTRGKNILDLVLTNNCDFIHNHTVMKTGLSDHTIIMTTLLLPPMQRNVPVEPRSRFAELNFYSEDVNWAALREDISRRPVAGGEGLSASEVYEHLINALYECSVRHVPRKKDARKNIIPQGRRRLMRKRMRLQRYVARASGQESLRLQGQIDCINIELKQSVDAEMQRDEDRAVEAVKVNPKYFYSYAKKYSKRKVAVGPLISGDHIISEPRHMAEELHRCYGEVYTTPCFTDVSGTVENYAGPERCNTIEDVNLTEASVKKSLLRLSDDSAPGPDGVPAVLLKRCAESLARPLAQLWRTSLDTGQVPQACKEGIVTPIFKGGNKGDCENYRPIVLTSHISKIFERVVAEKLMDHLEAEELLGENQHGFRRGRSCASQLIQHHHNVLRVMEGGSAADVVYLDFSRAFDKVDHGLLLIKLKSLGVVGTLAKWIESFLLGRRQKVVVGSHASEWDAVKSGVPQGTVLGPVLFLVYIADIDAAIGSVISYFADDTRLMRAIAEPEDVCILQRDLDKVYDWAASNNMDFNNGKFKVLHYMPNPTNQRSRHYLSPIGGHIESVDCVKDLGVVMSRTGKFKNQLEKIVNKARQMMGWIFRTFRTRDPQPMLILYKAIVLPHLEYCSQLWSPVALGSIRQLEAVQRTFTSRLHGLDGLDYWQRLEALGLYSLERRRERFLIIYISKMINGLAPMVDGPHGGELRVVQSERRGRYCMLPRVSGRAPSAVQTMLDHSLPINGVRLFNTLPRGLRECAGTLASFKKKLDAHLKSVPDHPYLPHYVVPVLSNSLIAHHNHC